jgi:hypothetical protein
MSRGSSPVVPAKVVVAGATGCGRGELLRSFAGRSGGVPVREGMLGAARVWRTETIWPQPLDDGRLMRLRVFSVTGHCEYNAPEELLLREADGVVALIDVTPEKLQLGWEAMMRLTDNLRRAGWQAGELPMVVQYHRSDRHPGFDPRRMDEWFGLPADGRMTRVVSRSDAVDFEGGAIDRLVGRIAAGMAASEAS